jgi:hypothetical protein
MSFADSLKWTTKTSLTSGKSREAADYVNGMLYVIDGSPGAGFSSSIEVYSTVTGTWRTDSATDLVARENLASAVDSSGNIYLIDGDNGSGVLAEVTRFNPFNDTVVQVASTSVARTGPPAAAAANGKIYVFGGLSSGGTALSSGEVYDPNTNTWSGIAPMPTALSGESAVADGSLIYVIGGGTNGIANSAVTSVFAYNTTSNTWSTVASLPTAVDFATAGLVDGKIVVAGGANSGGFLTTPQIYDPASNTWTTGSSSMPAAEAFAGQGVVSSGSQLFVAGGTNNNTALQTASVTTPADAQIYFRINNGQIGEIQLGDINADGTARHTIYTGGGDSSSPGSTGTGNETAVAVDTAAGLVFSVGPGDKGSFDAFSVHNLNTGALISTTEFGPNNGDANDDVVQSLAINVFTHTAYVADWGTTTAVTGFRQFSYDTSGNLTPLASNGGFLVTAAQNPSITDPLAMYVDTANHKLYYVDDDGGYNISPFSPTNGVFVLDLNSPSTSTELTSNGGGTGEFPTGSGIGTIGAHGNLVGLAVDVADGIVFFESTDVQGSANNALWWVNANGGANQDAVPITLPAGVTFHFAGQSSQGGIAAGLTFDPVSKELYLTDAENSAVTPNTGHLYVLQWNNASKTVSLVASNDVASLVGKNASNLSAPAAISTTTLDNLPTLTTSGTATHAVERGSNVTLLTSDTVADVDGDHLVSATVQITAGTFTVPSNDSSANDDHLTINSADRTGSDTSGTINGTSISYSYNSATETLTLTGYDTLADYQTALSFVQYFTTGHNPTDYGLNPARTITFQVNDGAIGNPSGTNTTTTTLNIDAVDDAPVASAPATYTEQEHVAFDLHNAGLNVSDVDGGITGQNETATLHVTEGTLHAAAGTGSSLGVGISGDNTGTLTITGTIAQINGLLNGDGDAFSVLTHTGNVDANDNPNSITLSLSIDDKGFTGSGGPLTSNTAQSTISAPDDTSVTFTGLSSGATGSPVQDQTITATVHDGGTTAIGVTFTWKVAGSPVVGNSSNTYTPTEADEGKTLTVDVSFNDPNDNLITETDTGIGVGVPNTVQDSADTVVTLSGLTGGNAVQGTDVTVTTITDGGQPVTNITYQWQRDGVDIGGATSATYTPTESDEGHSLTVNVGFKDANNVSETGTQSAGTVAEIAGGDTLVTITGLTGGNATQGTVATVTNVTDGGQPVTNITYQWQLDGVDIGGATNATYTPLESDEGHSLTVNVGFKDVNNIAETGTGAAGSVQDSADAVVTITGLTGGNATQGTVATVTNVTDNGQAVTNITYQWQLDGADIGGATNATYTPLESDEGHSLTVNVGFKDANNVSETATQSAGTVQDSADTVVTLSGLTGGNAVQGTVATVTNVTDGGQAVTNITYQWQRDGVDIGGATSATYTPTESDEAHSLTVNVGFKDANNVSETATQSAGTVQDSADTVVTLTGLTGGNATQGTVATVTNVTDGGQPVTNITYQWQRDGADIGGATNATYTPTESDEGHALTVNVGFKDVNNIAEIGTQSAGTVADSADLVATLSSATATEGTPISVATAADGGTNVLGTAAYQWKVNTGSGFVNATGTGATTATYTPTEGDEGGTLEVVVSLTDPGNPGNTETITVVAGTVHESPTENATISLAGLTSGNAVQDTQLTATVTDPDAPASGINYTWKVNGTTVFTGTDAAGKTYTPTEGNEGLPITVSVSFTDTHGNAESGTASGGTVQESPTENASFTVTGLVNGHAVPNHPVTATVTEPDAPGSGITYTWKVNGNTVKTGVDAAGNTYNPQPGDTGKTLTLSVSFTDTHGFAETGSGTVSSVTSNVKNDFDGDNKSDLLLQNQPFSGNPDVMVELLSGNGTTVASSATIATPPGWHVEASGDFNHDNKADIILQASDGLPQIWLMNGTSVTSTVTLPNPGPSWHVIAAADFYGDGNTDILWQNTDGTLAIWEMNGTSVATGIVLPNPGSSWHAIGAGDFNGDGKADILWQNSDGLAAIWEMNGGSILSAAVLPNPGVTWHAIGTGDFNGDGKADILWQNNDGLPAIWEMNGTAILSASVLPNPGANWHAIGTSDFNGDGMADIVWQNADGTPAIWEMNGFSIAAAGVLPNPGPTWHVKDDGPISPDPAGPGPQPPALHLSTPDAAKAVPMMSSPDASPSLHLSAPDGSAGGPGFGSPGPTPSGWPPGFGPDTLPSGVPPQFAATWSGLSGAGPGDQTWGRQFHPSSG